MYRHGAGASPAEPGCRRGPLSTSAALRWIPRLRVRIAFGGQRVLEVWGSHATRKAMASSVCILPVLGLLRLEPWAGRAPGELSRYVSQSARFRVSSVGWPPTLRKNPWLHDQVSRGRCPICSKWRESVHMQPRVGPGLSKSVSCFVAPALAALHQLAPSPSVGGVGA